MKPADPDAAYLWDLLDAARQLDALAAGLTRDGFMSDLRTRLAIERLFEIMGEAARRVSISGRLIHPVINWRGIIGLRNALAHQYGDIDYLRLWTAASQGVPELISDLERILGDAANE